MSEKIFFLFFFCVKRINLRNSTASSWRIFDQKSLSQIFDWVLNLPLVAEFLFTLKLICNQTSQLIFSVLLLGTRILLSNMPKRSWSQRFYWDATLRQWIKQIVQTVLITGKRKLLRSLGCAAFVSIEQFTQTWWVITLLGRCFKDFHGAGFHRSAVMDYHGLNPFNPSALSIQPENVRRPLVFWRLLG